jgi:hypothetical protein
MAIGGGFGVARKQEQGMAGPTESAQALSEEQAGGGQASKPVFEVQEFKKPCGYGPRVLQPSLDGKGVFIGCKDGSITVIRDVARADVWELVKGGDSEIAKIDDLEPRWIRTLPGLVERDQLAGVRALVEVMPGYLLAGREDGSLDLFDLRSASAVESRKVDLGYAHSGRVTFLDRLGNDHLVISARGLGTKLRKLDSQLSGEAKLDLVVEWLKRSKEDKLPAELANARAVLSCAAAIRDRESSQAFIFVLESGEAWSWGQGETVPERLPLHYKNDPSTRAGLVLDRASIKMPRGKEERGLSRGLYVPTDSGVFLIGSENPKVEAVPLPGLGQLCLSLTHWTGEARELLWVFDAEGYVHLFWRPEALDQPYSGQGWRRSGLRYEAAESMRAFALSDPEGSAGSEHSAGIFLVDVRRRDEIVFSRFRDLTAEPGAALALPGEESKKHLLFAGTAEELAAFVARSSGDRDPSAWAQPGWGIEWQLAAFFEHLGEAGSEADNKLLEDFLGAPTATLAVSVLQKLSKGKKAEGAQARASAQLAVGLWADALLGALGRNPYYRERLRSLYLAVARWLAVVRTELKADELDLDSAFQEHLDRVRHWAVFGPSSTPRRRIWEQIQILKGQVSPSGAPGSGVDSDELNLELLRYQTLLFSHGWDTEAEWFASSYGADKPGRPCLATHNYGAATYVAAWWPGGPIHLLQLSGGNGLQGPGTSWGFGREKAELKLSEAESAVVAMAFLQRAEVVWLVAAVAVGTNGEHQGFARELGFAQIPGDFGGGEPEWGRWLDLSELGGRSSDPPSPGNSEYGVPLERGQAKRQGIASLLPLSGERLVLGLTGDTQVCRLLVLLLEGVSVQADGRSDVPTVRYDFKLNIPSPAQAEPNPVSSLAAIEPEDLVFGCRDGRVFYLKLPSAEELKQICEGSQEVGKKDLEIEKEQAEQYEALAQLSGPVQRVAICADPPDLSLGGGRQLRVFATTTTGLIHAWMGPFSDLPSQDEHSAEGPRLEARSSFLPLWATHEIDAGEPVGMVMASPGNIELEGGEDRLPDLLVTVTDSGRLLVLGGGGEVTPSPYGSSGVAGTEDRLQRVRVPGYRYLRASLHTELCDLAALPCVSSSPSATESDLASPRARLLLQRRDGRLELVRLHLLRHTRSRWELLKKLDAGFHSHFVAEDAGAGTSTLRPGAYRAAERLRAGCSEFGLFVLRHLARQRGQGKGLESESLDAHLPQHFRELLPAFVALRERKPGHRAWEPLVQALVRIERSGDVRLLKEVLYELAHLFNEGLHDDLTTSAGSRQRRVRARAAQLRRLLRAISEALDHFPASQRGSAERARIHFLKELFNGGVLLGLAEFARQMETAPTEEEGNVYSNSGPATEIVQFLLQDLRRLALAGTPLVPLEALRAVNLAWTACCQKAPQGKTGIFPWWQVEKLVALLRDIANVFGHRQQVMSEALLNEISRCYALALWSCPGNAVNIAYSVSETGPKPEELPRCISEQLEVLRSILRPASEEYKELSEPFSLFETTSKALAGLKGLLVGRKFLTKATVLGVEKLVFRADVSAPDRNSTGLQDAARFHALVSEIDWLRDKLTSDPAGIELEPLRKALALVQEASSAWKHSKELWKDIGKALSREADAAKNEPLQIRARERISPELIRASRDLMGWAEAGIKHIKNARDREEIFEPQASFYKTALERLKEAAEHFPRSAAVQASLVEAILSHGLIAELDEHVLELEEIAQALDPILVEEYRRRDRKLHKILSQEGSVAAQFSAYLLSRACNAEAIPKNLRMLQSILKERDGGRKGEDLELAKVLSLAKQVLELDMLASADSACPSPLLRLAFHELLANHNDHGSGELLPKVSAEEPHPNSILLTFPARSEDRDRLERVVQAGLERPVEPNRSSRVPSHGTGLYLAHLACSIEHCRLVLELSDEMEPFPRRTGGGNEIDGKDGKQSSSKEDVAALALRFKLELPRRELKEDPNKGVANVGGAAAKRGDGGSET